MNWGALIRTRAVGTLLCMMLGAGAAVYSQAPAGQAPSAANATIVDLLGKAHTLEVRGRMDMAKQMWSQVLLVDQNNTEALAGMARAAKVENDPKALNQYLQKLRDINPNDPNIARVENMGTAQDQNQQLQEAGRLAQQGQYARAMTILRQVYGTNPPPGDAAISYYQTEAATEDGRPHAIAGLRALVDKYPQDSRYQVALGTILTYNPRTRAEGRKLLSKHPDDPGAVAALKQSLLWDAQNPATAGDIKAYLNKHPDTQLSTALQQEQAQIKRSGGGKPQRVLTPEEQAAQAAYAARSAEEQAAYNALNAKHIDDADARFKAILAKNPNDWQAQAGLGYVRMNQTNFGGAISYFEQAKQNGAKDPAVDRALADSRFYFTMQTATAALNQSDLVTAQQQFAAAVRMRPTDAEALLGLGGTLLKAQQPEAAMPVFTTYVKLHPADMAAWRGLFMSEYGSGKYNDALATDKRVPVKVHAELLKDPDYLRTLASVYLALGRDADAQRVLKAALELPFPAGGRGLKEDMQTQFAALLVAAGHKEQAVGLYRQVLAEDPSNTNAWVGVVQTEHVLGQDSAAYQALTTMPPDKYQQAMQEPGFETTVAAIYEGQGHDDMARDVLEKFLAKQQAEGRKPFIPAEIQLAGIYLRQGESAKAYPLYQSIIANNPQRSDAWLGLIGAMHATGHDQEAMAELQQIPADVRKDLENDPAFLETVGSIYAGTGHPQEAMMFLNRAEEHYRTQKTTPPADIGVQTAWLLYNSHNDAALWNQLMQLGSRTDLTDQQRLTVQTIWTNFAVRRANAEAARGDYPDAIALLNATAKTFPGNPDVVKALASGYAAAGNPKLAVAYFKSLDLNRGTASDYRAAIGAALAANDTKDAEVWLRFALSQYPNDPQILVLAGKFEQAIGDAPRAEEYYRASLKLMPQGDPGMEVAGALMKPSPVPAALPTRTQPQDLASILSQPERTTPDNTMVQQTVQRPYLPSYNAPGASVPVTVMPQGTYPQYGSQYGTQQQPSTYMMYGPDGQPQTMTPSNQAPANQVPAKNSTLKDYIPPQSRLEITPDAAIMKPHAETVAAVRELHVPRGEEAVYRSFVPGADYDSHLEAELLIAGAKKNTSVQGNDVLAGFRGDGVEGVRMVATSYHAQQQSTDSTPVVPYAAVARPVAKKPSPAVQVAQPKTRLQPTQQQSAASRQAQASSAAIRSAHERAEAIRANQQDAAQMTGASRPPQESYDIQAPAQTTQFNPSAQLNNAQYSNYSSAQQGTDGQTAQPRQQPQGYVAQPLQQATPPTPGQQYPQPTGHATSTGTRRKAKAKAEVQPAPETPVVQQTQPMQYPVYPQPLSNPGYPAVGPAYPMGQAPTDYQLQQQNLPPLRGSYDPRTQVEVPLSDRQRTEQDLASLEGAYSGWVGGSVIGRYRSGTPGVDRLAALEVPFEASVVIGQGLRLSIIPTAVFLNSGQLNTQGGTLGSTPVLGSIYGTDAYNPPQQFASGIGGEFQVATNTFQAAIGTTPYQFLVENVIGRFKWKPNNGRFTFFGGRDAVKETQLSYAGMRDPGSATTTYSGNVWGGVVATGGGVRFDSGNERSGLYIQGEGADLTGYHVLENRRYDGTMGAYFRVKTWPEYGSLNVGGTFFGEHFDYNERPATYGLGGYFSPEAYFLAAVPITFNGHYGEALHYEINGSVGVQTFQESNQKYFPLDSTLELGAVTACQAASSSTVTIINQTCGQTPVNSNTGLNYAIDAKVSYHINDHWYIGGFLSGNNTNNYNTISGGFFGRYTFKIEVQTVDYPTGLFPVESTDFRPLKVP